jgi:hypothetical protein
MLIDNQTRPVALPEARLLIHTESHQADSGRFATTLRRLRALCFPGHNASRGQLRLQIADLQGKVVMASHDASAVVDVSLPAGTYQVKAQFGDFRRDYTLTLTQGMSFDLYLQFASQKH